MVDFSKFAADPDRADHIKWNVRPLVETQRAEPYPLDALPPIVRDAIEEVASYVQAPVALIAASALSAVSTAVQTRFSVQRDARLSGPASLYLLTVAESGERKSTVDKMFTAAVREWEAKQKREFRERRAQYEAAMEDWQRDGRALQDRLKAGAPADELSGEFDPRVIHEMNKPTEPKLRTILYGDDTPEALAMALADYPVASILSAEAGVIFGSHGMNADSVTRNLAQANAMWDGDAIRQGRVGRDRLVVEGMRVTMGLQVQPAVLDAFIQKTSGLARGIGYFARFLFSRPESTQGGRFYVIEDKDTGALRAFNEHMTTLLNIPAEFDEYGRLAPHYVGFDPDAYEVWYRFHDEVEEQLGDGDVFSGIRDVASKAADNAARLACCLHVFEGIQAPQIGRVTMLGACSLMRWYLDEAVRFATARDASPEVHHAQILEEWLVREVKRRGRKGADVLVAVNEVRQLGPNALRGGGRLDAAIELLHDLGRLVVLRRTGRKGYDLVLATPVLREYS